TYYQPKTPEQAVGLLDTRWGTTEMLAGGTDLLDLQKEYIAQPEKVISLTGLGDAYAAGLKGTTGNATTQIGAGTKLAAIAEDKFIQTTFPALATAAGI